MLRINLFEPRIFTPDHASCVECRRCSNCHDCLRQQKLLDGPDCGYGEPISFEEVLNLMFKG